MAQLIVKRLKARAKRRGVSTEEAHRRLLEEVLLKEQNRELTLMEHPLSAESSVDSDEELELER